MRLHTDVLTEADLREALPSEVCAYITPHGSRKRRRAFEVTLYVTAKDELHTRYGNSGGYGASSDVAATWDEWGIWIARLFERDYRALIGWYESWGHFLDATERHRDYVRRTTKPHHIAWRTHLAPWLDPPAGYERQAEESPSYQALRRATRTALRNGAEPITEVTE